MYILHISYRIHSKHANYSVSVYFSSVETETLLKQWKDIFCVMDSMFSSFSAILPRQQPAQVTWCRSRLTESCCFSFAWQTSLPVSLCLLLPTLLKDQICFTSQPLGGTNQKHWEQTVCGLSLPVWHLYIQCFYNAAQGQSANVVISDAEREWIYILLTFYNPIADMMKMQKTNNVGETVHILSAWRLAAKVNCPLSQTAKWSCNECLLYSMSHMYMWCTGESSRPFHNINNKRLSGCRFAHYISLLRLCRFLFKPPAAGRTKSHLQPFI